MAATRRRRWSVLLLALLSACTSAVDGVAPSPSPLPSAAASPPPVSAAPSQRASPSESAACSVVRSTDIDTTATAGTPEGALAAFASGRRADFASVVSGRGVTFYAMDGTRSVVVERVERAWAATAVSEPSCPPPVVLRGAQANEGDLACKRAAGGSVAGPLAAQSELEAVADYVRFLNRPHGGAGGLSSERYVRIAGRDRPFGRFDDGGLQEVIRVNGAQEKFAVDTIIRC